MWDGADESSYNVHFSSTPLPQNRSNLLRESDKIPATRYEFLTCAPFMSVQGGMMMVRAQVWSLGRCQHGVSLMRS